MTTAKKTKTTSTEDGVGAVPATPTAPVFESAAPTRVRLSWPQFAGVQRLELSYRTAAVGEVPAGSWRRWRRYGSIATAYTVLGDTVTGLSPATVYEFRLAGANSDGNSDYSPSLTVQTQWEAAVAIKQRDLTHIQSGVESTSGTAVAATRSWPWVSASFTPGEERQTLDEGGTKLADTEDVVTGRMSTISLTEEFSCEAFLKTLLASVAKVAPTGVASAQQWVFVPSVTAASGLDTFTWEVGLTDGGSGTWQRQVAFARATGWTVTAGTGTSRLATTWEGRAAKPLAALADVDTPPRTILASGLWSAFIDDSWASLGTTKMGTLHGLTFGFEPGQSQQPGLTGRSDLDASYYRRGRIGGTVGLVVDNDGPADAELGHWESGDLRYVRLEASNGLSGASARSVQIDCVSRYVATPEVLAADGAVHTLDLSSELRADDDDRILSITVICGLTTP